MLGGYGVVSFGAIRRRPHGSTGVLVVRTLTEPTDREALIDGRHHPVGMRRLISGG